VYGGEDLGELAREELKIGDHVGQRVVELMRHAGGERPHRNHAVHLHEVRRERPLLRHITQHGEDDHVALLTIHAHATLQREDAAVPAESLKRLHAPEHRTLPRRQAPGQILLPLPPPPLGDEHRERLADQLRARPAEHLLRRPVDVREAPVPVHQHHPVGRVLDDLLEPPLRRAHQRREALLAREILDDEEQSLLLLLLLLRKFDSSDGDAHRATGAARRAAGDEVEPRHGRPGGQRFPQRAFNFRCAQDLAYGPPEEVLPRAAARLEERTVGGDEFELGVHDEQARGNTLEDSLVLALEVEDAPLLRRVVRLDGDSHVQKHDLYDGLEDRQRAAPLAARCAPYFGQEPAQIQRVRPQVPLNLKSDTVVGRADPGAILRVVEAVVPGEQSVEVASLRLPQALERRRVGEERLRLGKPEEVRVEAINEASAAGAQCRAHLGEHARVALAEFKERLTDLKLPACATFVPREVARV
jgi:hypothetical protein